MLYHASPVGGLRVLEPAVSNHGRALVYFSRKRENVLVYLCNAVERYCRETGFAHTGRWTKWGPYGFEPDGRLRLEEYYPDALEVYRGVSGWIYCAEEPDGGEEIGIPDALAVPGRVAVRDAEFVPDALEAIVRAEAEGQIVLRRFGEMNERERRWIRETVVREYAEAADRSEYRHFLRGKLGWALEGRQEK